ncbi:MAG: hypothetical protein ABIQ31_07170 [Ferruginibacter sp.]
MNINRHNYETFFLLYTDNELSVAEKKAVEEFVKSNPDLQEELVMLQQSVLKPDSIVFDDKLSLFKNESVPTDIQEELLLHLDKELTAARLNDITALIGSDSNVKREWDILQQTRLLPDDTILFPDKQSLYRKERGRVIAFPWLRVVAAALFIGFGILGVTVYLNRSNKTANVETVKKNETKSIPSIVTPVPGKVVVPGIPVDTKEQALVAAPADNKKTSNTKTLIPASKEIEPSRLTKKDAEPIAVVEKDNNLPKPYSNNLNKIKSNETIPSDVTIQKQPNNIVDPGNNDIGGNQTPANQFASTAAYTGDSEENNDRVLFMDEEKVKKTKLGGIFRKVKRVLERKANIKPGGNNIKVANLEFAIQ